MQTLRLTWSFGAHSEQIPQSRIFYHDQSRLYPVYQGELNQLIVWLDNAAYLQLNFNQPSIIPHSIKRLGEYLVFVPLLELEAWQAQFELTSMALADYVNLKLPAIVIEQQQCCTLWHDLHQPDDYLATIEPINSNELAWLWLLSSQIPPVDQSIRLFTSYANQISSVLVAQDPESSPSIGGLIQAILAGRHAFCQTLMAGRLLAIGSISNSKYNHGKPYGNATSSNFFCWQGWQLPD